MGEVDRASFEARGFGQRVGFGARPALLMIDLIRGFTDASMPLGADLTSEIDATRRVLAAARSARVPAFYTTVQ